MNNLLNREEYILQMNEGLGDTIKKGVDKLKSLFKIGIQKIRDFIAVFDTKGNVYPVVTPQAVIDRFSNSDVIGVYGTGSMDESVKNAGGNGCDDKAPIKEDTVDDFGPSGKEFAQWMEEEKFKETKEYQNLLSMSRIIKEHYNCTDDKAKEIFEDIVGESWEGVTKKRVSYVDKKELSELKEIDNAKYETLIDELIDDWSVNNGDTKVRDDGKEVEASRNVLIFGAPGIGKSTIPNQVVKKFNEKCLSDPSKMISLISINCALIHEGDLMMPTMPKETDIIKSVERFSKAFPKSKEFIEDLDDEQIATIAQTISASGQFKSSDAPKSWLPSYKSTGDANVDKLLNDYANGGVYKDDKKNTYKTGGGGIILFDEFLRADAVVFDQLMNFFLDRKLQDWELGSKWCIIACSNRPCDDGRVENVWKEWNDSPASKDRLERMFQIIPDPEQWKTWAKSKGCDDLILDFIFDEKSKTGDEYPRWHSTVRRGANDSKQVKPITPRNWASAFNAINRFEVKNDLKTISQMSVEDISDVLGGFFDKSFVDEIVTWIDDHNITVSLDEIIKNPKSVKLPSKIMDGGERDEGKMQLLISNLTEQFIDKFEEHPEDCTDDVLANIFTWLGINYKGDITTVNTGFFQYIDKVLKPDGDNSVAKHTKAMLIMYAAFPEAGWEDDVKAFIEEWGWPKNSIEIVKANAKKYFPWRLDENGEIIIYDELVKPDEDEAEPKE